MPSNKETKPLESIIKKPWEILEIKKYNLGCLSIVGLTILEIC